MKLRDNWEEHLRNPPPGSKAYEAKEFGVDMEELIANLKLTPAERLKKHDRLLNEAHARGVFYVHYPAWDLSRKPK
jgi:hypothetical protein